MNTDKIQTRQFSQTEIGALADAFNKSPLTIQRWIDRNDDRLTTPKAVQALERLEGIRQSATTA